MICLTADCVRKGARPESGDDFFAHSLSDNATCSVGSRQLAIRGKGSTAITEAHPPKGSRDQPKGTPHGPEPAATTRNRRSRARPAKETDRQLPTDADESVRHEQAQSLPPVAPTASHPPSAPQSIVGILLIEVPQRASRSSPVRLPRLCDDAPASRLLSPACACSS